VTAGLLLLLALASPQSGATPQLLNPGFEAGDTAPGQITGWELSKAPESVPVAVQGDNSEVKEGKRSLRVEAQEPAEASLSQELFLPVGSLWKVRVWVKTADLSGSGAAAGGQITVETPAGDQGHTPARTGTSPWQEESVLFRVPSPGRVRIRLTAFEHASGRVWFDGVSLDLVASLPAADVHISYSKISSRPIDLKLGGQFMEPLCRMLPSMLAQQVESTSFEEEPPWNPSYKREVDKPCRPWYPDGAVHDATFNLDTENPFNGKRSERIDLPVAGARAGISQDGFYLTKGVGYKLHLHMRSRGGVKVWATLRGDGGLIAGPVSLGRAGEAWQGAHAVLRANRTVENATLMIEFEGPGTLWLDRIYLIGEDAVLGIWRPDVVSALKALNPGVVRFGGSAMETFEWDKCIGPWDQRVPYVTQPWGGLDSNFAGVEEFIQVTRYIGAEPLICVRWSGRKPEDAAAEVEYFNGSAQTHWGKLRAQYGHPEPYHVKYWQIGNEVGGREYDASVRAFAEAIRAADPSIKVLSSFPSADTLKEGGGYLDYLCPHHYECLDLRGKEKDFEFLRDQVLHYGKGRDVRVAVTEWNTTAGQMGLTRGMLLTLGNALGCSRYENLLHRYADLVEIAVRSNLSDSFGSGILQPGPGWLYLSPTYYSQKLYQRAAGTFPLSIKVNGGLAGDLADPDLSATIDAAGEMLRIYAVNSTPQTETTRFHLEGFPAAVAGGEMTVLKDREGALDSEAMNTHNDPHRIDTMSRPAGVKGNAFEFPFEPFSVTLLELKLAK